jgi:hypothetical protein
VREAFGTDAAFGVAYADKLKVITGGEDFFLGLPDSREYRAQLAAMRRVVMASDLSALGDRAEALAKAVVATSGGRVDVVSLVRQVTFGLIPPYFGVPEPKQGRLDVWATRLFEYQFTGSPSDTALRAEVDEIAPAFRAHIDREIRRRKATPDTTEDVLRRCLNLQAAGETGYSDLEIRTALLCMVVGGPPQPPIVVPQAKEQLLTECSRCGARRCCGRTGCGLARHRPRGDAFRSAGARAAAHRAEGLDHCARNQTRDSHSAGGQGVGRVRVRHDGRAAPA